MPLPAKLFVLKDKIPDANRTIFIANRQTQAVWRPCDTSGHQRLIDKKWPKPAARPNESAMLAAGTSIDHAYTAIIANDRELRPVRRTVQFESRYRIPEGSQGMRKGLAQLEVSNSCVAVHKHLFFFLGKTYQAQEGGFRANTTSKRTKCVIGTLRSTSRADSWRYEKREERKAVRRLSRCRARRQRHRSPSSSH